MALGCLFYLTDLRTPKYKCGNLKVDLVLGAWNFSLHHKARISCFFFSVKNIVQGQVCCQCFWMWIHLYRFITGIFSWFFFFLPCYEENWTAVCHPCENTEKLCPRASPPSLESPLCTLTSTCIKFFLSLLSLWFYTFRRIKGKKPIVFHYFI